MKGLKPRSVNTIIGALKSYFKRLADTGAIALNPTAFIKKRKDGAGISLPGNLTHSLSESEMLLLFDRLAEHGAPQRDILLLKTLFMTGLRGEEAVSLCWKDVTVWQGQRYFNVLGKGSKERRIYLPDEIDEGLNEYGKLTGTSPNQHLWEPQKTIPADRAPRPVPYGQEMADGTHEQAGCLPALVPPLLFYLSRQQGGPP